MRGIYSSYSVAYTTTKSFHSDQVVMCDYIFQSELTDYVGSVICLDFHMYGHDCVGPLSTLYASCSK